jgi:hypothetical protein
MNEPVDHVVRPRLPWRDPSDPATTECGYDASKVKSISREEFLTRLKELGQQRCALLTCMTCSNASWRWPTWEQSPLRALDREISWEIGKYGRVQGGVLRDEMLAVAALIAEHPERFRGLVKEIQDRREWLNRAALRKTDQGRAASKRGER